MSANKCFNLVNPLSWFLLEDHAKTTPSPSGTDLKVKPMLGGRASRAHKIKMHYLLQRKLLDNTGYHK